MKLTRSRLKNLIFLAAIALLIIPQTRTPIQVFLNKGLALFGPSIEDTANLKHITDYNWRLKSINNEVLDFNTVQGKVVLINFWATWCPPCIAEMPSMKALYADYKDKIEFVFVSNEKPKTIKAFLTKNNYTFNVYTPLTKHPDVFNIKGIPRTFLIDTNGNIVIDKTGAANWNSDTVRHTIDSLLNTANAL
ncbi:thiol-disulfide isomerase/thioredoxin [Jejuia pallidilutea]|uniref:Thiol-disulfide isomerase/thioredoxin n=1 Tax=Jejuia pallidilutea TaxID=504487 RepID=A0A362X056_9FLAO|nr:TlpA disulfide reductase family protein [Jejuia pallidilutea]PQV48939.1 thiol-disulfide isomerase/thioredoxin [Jejuia pallidilutea]